MRKLLYLLGVTDSSSKAVERINENKSAKTLDLIAMSFVLLIGTFIICCYLLIKYSSPINRPIVEMNIKTAQGKDLITLDYPFQSYVAVEKWVLQAVTDLNNLSFHTLESDLERNRKYFIDNKAFNMYKSGLENLDVIKTIEENNLFINAIPLTTPIYINSGQNGNNFFWVFHVPILVNYMTGSKNDKVEFYNVEIIVFRTPAYENHKGLAISSIVTI